MPSCRPNTIPLVVNILLQLKPTSILDVGIGFGKWGHLFREYTDIIASEHDADRYLTKNWKVRIDGIEGFPDYVTDMHYFIYDEIHIGDMTQVLPTLDSYDMIYLGDVIEHIDKESGRQLLKAAVEHANKAVVVSTPKYYLPQKDICENSLEIHRSHWTARDFRAIANAQIATVDKTILVAVLSKGDVQHLRLKRPIFGRSQRARELVRKSIIALIGEPLWKRLRGHHRSSNADL